MSTTMTTPQPQAQSVVVDDVPDPQVPERPRRRTYPARYKRDILAEYEACDGTLSNASSHTAMRYSRRVTVGDGGAERAALPGGQNPGQLGHQLLEKRTAIGNPHRISRRDHREDPRWLS